MMAGETGDAATETRSTELDAAAVDVTIAMTEEMGMKSSWSLVIAIAALGLSVGGLVYGISHNRAQEILALRRELNEAFEQAAEIERLAMSSTAANPANPKLAESINQNASLELSLIASRAEEISQLLPAERISQTDVFRIGTMLAADPERLSEAADYFLRAASGKNLSVSIESWSSLAAAEFSSGQQRAGREYFKRAVAVLDAFTGKPVSETGVALMKLQIYLAWARSEAFFGDKMEAASPLGKAREISNKLDPRLVPPFVPQLLSELQAIVSGQAPVSPESIPMLGAPALSSGPSGQ